MIVRRFFIAVTAATLVVGSCGGDPPPPPPAPPGPDMDSLRAYQASVRAAEEEARRLAAEEAARRAEEAERERARQRASQTLQQMVFFDYDMSEIRDDAASALRAKVDIMRASPQVQLRIEGHAAERGSTEYNLALGHRRGGAGGARSASGGTRRRPQGCPAQGHPPKSRSGKKPPENSSAPSQRKVIPNDGFRACRGL